MLPLLVCGLYVFNPAIWYVSVRWGQIESVYTLFLVVAVVALERGAVAPAGLAYTVAMATKLLGVALAPLLVAWTITRFGWRALATGLGVAAATALVIVSPWLAAGRIGELLHHAYIGLPTEAPKVDVSAYNLWYLLFAGRVHDASSHAHVPLLGVRYQTVAIALFGAFAVLVVTLALRRSGGVALPAAILSLGLFMLLTQAHERYLFPVLAFVLLAAGLGAVEGRTPGYWWEYGVLSLGFLFNLVTIAPFTPSLVTNLITVDATSPKLVVLKIAALVVAVAGLVVLASLLAKMLGGGRWRATRQPA
jgi:hypothetical protein